MEEQQKQELYLKPYIDYPLSTKYRSEWGTWEAVREIVQNALDSESSVNMEFKNETLKVSDAGEGFEMKHLLIGESSKDGEKTIGKFGEGLKFALLVLLREKCEVVIRSNGTIFYPKITKIFDTNCLRINYASADEKHPGTEITIQGIEQSYRGNFLSLDHKANFQTQVLLELPGKLFVKGIFVQDIKAISGYNLVVERENPITGSVDMDRVRSGLYRLIRDTDHLGYMESLLEAVKDDPENEGRYLEYEAGSWSTWSMKHPELWKKVSDRILGPKVCLATSRVASTEALHRGFIPIECKAHFLKGVLKTDAECIQEDQGKDVKTMFDLEKLPFDDRENLREVFWLMQKGLGDIDYCIKQLRIVDFGDNTVGRSSYHNVLDISYTKLEDFDSLLEVILHEYVHFAYGCMDLTDEFTSQLSAVHIAIIKHLKYNEYTQLPKDFLKETPLRYKSEEEIENGTKD